MHSKISLGFLFAGLIVIFALLVNSISQSVVSKGVNEIELREAEKDMKELLSLLRYSIIRFKHHVFDWSVFDEAYNYVQKKDNTFISRNFNQLKIDAMHFTGCAVYDIDGKRLSFVDGSKKAFGEEWVHAEREAFDRLAQKVWDEGIESTEGFLYVNNVAMIVAIHKIFDSSKRESANGYLIMGIALDSSFRKEAQSIAGLHFSVLPLEIFNKKSGIGLASNCKLVQTPNTIHVYSAVTDIFGDVSFSLELEKERNIAAFGREISNKNYVLMLFLCVLVLCAGLMILHFAHRRFVREEMDYRARHDSLTDLPNGLFFQERLAERVKKARKNDSCLGVLYINVDSFKSLNDCFGYKQGDFVLIEITKRLRNILSEGDIARAGADNFLAMVSAKKKKFVVARAKSIQKVLYKPFIVCGSSVHIETSIGIAFHTNTSQDSLPLVHQAEQAMVDAKKNDGNSISLFDEGLHTAAVEKMHLEIALRKAVENNAFTVHYQPKIDIETNDVAGCEALVRWQTSDGTWVPPPVFIPIAEKTGLVTQIDMFVLRSACRQVLLWQKDGSGAVPVAVNMSVHSILSNGFADQVRRILEEEGTPPSLIDIEITESSFMTDMKKAFAAISQLSQAGIHIALDDFGTGYSSLKYLSDMPISCLKIDKAFVDDIFSGKKTAQPLIKSIISLAASLGLATVSEGVENKNQLAFLVGNGSHIIQGFLFSKPLSAKACGEFLRNRKACIDSVL
ncbi:MAG: bifunctional diguanylate cyclase/phosphodiesterase [Desulfovibrionaceae bacterium]|nr:bifunctional diguanylate cyclase/phosphodiesterase [Desulfovibrionaceae bacterium]